MHSDIDIDLLSTVYSIVWQKHNNNKNIYPRNLVICNKLRFIQNNSKTGILDSCQINLICTEKKHYNLAFFSL